MQLPNKTYDVVLADPPWSYYGQQNKMGAAANHYQTMTDEDLQKMNIPSLLNDKAVLFMWATAPRLNFALDLIQHYGLHYRGVAFVWVKTKKDGTPIGAQGVRPSIVKPTTEFVLAASTVPTGRPLKLHDETIRQVLMSPKQEHSRKPDDVHEAINKMYPQASKLELFARRPYPNWDTWGNELNK